MLAITALINIFGRIAILLIEAQIKMMFALRHALGAGISALWSSRHRTRRPQRKRRR